MKTLPPIHEMDKAVNERDASYDGVFFTAVKTTGIFCRPSCPAKTPRPENRRYFASAREAVFAGFRPCKRCRPMDTNGRPPDWVERLLSAVDQSPTERLSDQDVRDMGIDPARARRYFLKHFGMTFQAYLRGRRLGEAFQHIQNGSDITDTAFESGYESVSGFREAFVNTFGKTPGKSRAADCVVTTWIETPIGPFVAGANEEGVCLLEFTDRRALETQVEAVRKRLGCAVVPGNNRHLDQLKDEFARYFDGTLTEFTVPLVYPGSPFQMSVWEQLLKIPYGETISYQELADRIGNPKAVRAVGHANGQNRIAVVIPCHRVINKNGDLCGYGGGLWRKKALLELETRVAGKETVPGSNFSLPFEFEPRRAQA